MVDYFFFTIAPFFFIGVMFSRGNKVRLLLCTARCYTSILPNFTYKFFNMG